MTRFNPNKLYKNPREGKCMGVCAGVADYFDVRVGLVRFLFILAVLWSGFTALVPYFILGFVLDRKPDALYEDPAEDEFWKKVRTQPDYTAVDLRRRFDDIERRTRDMEAYMTSKKFKLDRDLRDLAD